MSESQLFALALMGVVLGPPLAIWPRWMAKGGEMLDAIGRKPAGPVEPAAWNVLLTQVVGVVWFLASLVAWAAVLL